MLCLQEVQSNHIHDFLAPELDKVNSALDAFTLSWRSTPVQSQAARLPVCGPHAASERESWRAAQPMAGQAKW